MRISVMSSGSAEPGLDHVAAEFGRLTGVEVDIVYNREVEGFDVAVASSDAIERKLRPAGRICEGGVVIGRMGLGIAIRPGAACPDISDKEAFGAALAAANTIVLTHNHSSGLYVESMFATHGWDTRLDGKIERLPNGPAAMDRILRGSGDEFAILSVNEIRTYREKGLVLVGPLPAEIQYIREFIAVPSLTTEHQDVAWQFANFCGERGRLLLAQHGFE